MSIKSIIAVVIIVAAPVLAGAVSSPRSFVQKLSGEAHTILNAGDVKRANELFVDYFDMPTFGKSCLIDHWDEFTKTEQSKFLELLDLNLRKSMSEKMLLKKEDVNFQFIPQKVVLNNGIARVENKLTTNRGQFNLVIFIIRDKSSYRITDYELEGALLSRNYRGHFNHMIRKYGKQGMLNRMADKLVE